MNLKIDSTHSLISRSELKENVLSPHSARTASSEKMAVLWLQVEAFETQLNSYIDNRDKDFERIKQTIDQADDLMRKRRAEFREGFVRKMEDFKDYQVNIENFYKIELQRKNDFGWKVNEIVHERIYEVSGTVDAYKSKTELLDQQFRQQSFEVIDKLKEENQAIDASHAEFEDNIGANSDEFYNHIRQDLSSEIKDRQECEKAVYDLFASMARNVEHRIGDEGKTRKQRVEEIVGVLEETCVRLENAST